MHDWIAEIRALPADSIFISHRPRTPRHVRAETLLPYLLEHAVLVGVAADPDRPDATLISAWAPHPEGQRRGFYCCFRAHLQPGSPWARLYCFYDDRNNSPQTSSADAAKKYAARHGFTVKS